jgi:hypothetical protein
MLAVPLALAGAACSKGPSEEQCARLLDHLVDLELKRAGAATPPSDTLKAELAKQKAAVVESKSAEFMATCRDKTHVDRVECALAATDLAGVAKCDEAK